MTATHPPASTDPRQPAGLGCAALAVSALIVFGYALFKYQQSAVPDVPDADLPVHPPEAPPAAPVGPAIL